MRAFESKWPKISYKFIWNLEKNTSKFHWFYASMLRSVRPVNAIWVNVSHHHHHRFYRAVSIELICCNWLHSLMLFFFIKKIFFICVFPLEAHKYLPRSNICTECGNTGFLFLTAKMTVFLLFWNLNMSLKRSTTTF